MAGAGTAANVSEQGRPDFSPRTEAQTTHDGAERSETDRLRLQCPAEACGDTDRVVLRSEQCLAAKSNSSHVCWQIPDSSPPEADIFHVSRLHGLNAQLCSNCKDKESLTREVIMTVHRLSIDDYQTLTDNGWFRRGSKPLYQYRYVHEPKCGTYDTRTDVHRFNAQASSTYRRVLKRCARAGVHVETVEPTFRPQAYELYNRYQVTKHDKPRKTPEGYRAHAVDSPIVSCMRDGVQYGTVHQHYWMNGELIGVGVLDVLPRTLISVYMYYDVQRPEVARLSLGVFAALQEIAFAQHLNNDLGANIAYYTMGGFSLLNDKLAYKASYLPVQYLASWASSLWVDSLETCYVLARLNHFRLRLKALRLDRDQLSQHLHAHRQLKEDVGTVPTPPSELLHGCRPARINMQYLLEAVLERPLEWTYAGIESRPCTMETFLSLLGDHLCGEDERALLRMFDDVHQSGEPNSFTDLHLFPDMRLDVDSLYHGLVDCSQASGNPEHIRLRLPDNRLVRLAELKSVCAPVSKHSFDILRLSLASLAGGLGPDLARRTVVDLAALSCRFGNMVESDV